MTLSLHDYVERYGEDPRDLGGDATHRCLDCGEEFEMRFYPATRVDPACPVDDLCPACRSDDLEEL